VSELAQIDEVQSPDPSLRMSLSVSRAEDFLVGLRLAAVELIRYRMLEKMADPSFVRNRAKKCYLLLLILIHL